MVQTSDSSRGLIVGNASIDAYIKDEKHSIIGETVTISQGTREITIKLDYSSGFTDKMSAIDEFFRLLQGFEFSEKFGGGAYNSVTSFRKISQGLVSLLDPQTPALDSTVPGSNLKQYLQRQGIDARFLSTVAMPVNIILGDRGGKLIIKGPKREYSLSSFDNREVDSFLREYKFTHFLINSLKGHQLAEKIVRQNNVMAVITKSLDPNFVLQVLAPRCDALQFNYDEFGYIINDGNKVIGDENERFESAIDGILRLKTDYNTKGNIYVTLGSNGILASSKGQIHHIRLVEETGERVTKYVAKDSTCVTGAGDCAAAYLFKGLINGLEPKRIGLEGCIGAIHHLGYHSISADDFISGSCKKGLAPKTYKTFAS